MEMTGFDSRVLTLVRFCIVKGRAKNSFDPHFVPLGVGAYSWALKSHTVPVITMYVKGRGVRGYND